MSFRSRRLRVGVDLEEGAGAHGGLDHPVHVDRVGLAPADQPARRVADHVDQRVLHRGHHPVGHLALGHAEGRVHAGHDPVELREQVVLVVQRPVGRTFVSVPARTRKPSIWASTSATRSIWRRSSSGVTWLPNPCDGGVIGDREVLVAALLGGLRHLGDRVAPVGGDGVRVQVAADVPQLEEGREARRPARPAARRGSRAAPAARTPSPAARRPPPRSRSYACLPSASSAIPYSLTCSPRLTASVRSASL